MPEVWKAEWVDGPARGMRATMLNPPKHRMSVRQGQHSADKSQMRHRIKMAVYEADLDWSDRTAIYRFVGIE